MSLSSGLLRKEVKDQDQTQGSTPGAGFNVLLKDSSVKWKDASVKFEGSCCCPLGLTELSPLGLMHTALCARLCKC